MIPPARIIDTSAIGRYVAADGLEVASVLAVVDAAGFSVIAPATCISEAYWAIPAQDEPMLDVFRTLPQVRVDPLKSGDAQAVGGLAQFLGTLGMAHACLLALVMDLPLVTAEPAVARKVLRPDLIWEV